VPKNRSVNAQILAVRRHAAPDANCGPSGRFAADERGLEDALRAARARESNSYRAIRAKLNRYYKGESKLDGRLGASSCTLESRASR
jgi:hypothetical protein